MEDLNENLPRPHSSASHDHSDIEFATRVLQHDPIDTMRVMLRALPQRVPEGFATEAEHTAAQEECSTWAEQTRQLSMSA